MNDSITSKLSRLSTKTYEEENNINNDDIVNLYISLHGGELLEDEIKFPPGINKKDVRIYSYVGKAGLCNIGNFYQSKAFASTFLQEINSKMRENPEESSYNIIREQMQTTVREEMDTTKKIVTSKDVLEKKIDLWVDHVDSGENIRTYNPIINKYYSSRDTLGFGGIFLEVKNQDGTYQIENIISIKNVIIIINNKKLSQKLRDRFHFLLVKNIYSTNQIYLNRQDNMNKPSSIGDISYDYNLLKALGLIVDDGNFDVKKIEFSFEESDPYKYINMSYKCSWLSYDSASIGFGANPQQNHGPHLAIPTPYFIKGQFEWQDFLFDGNSLRQIYLPDIINLCSELGMKGLNIIDTSCRSVRLNSRSDEFLAYDDPKVIELQEREFAETNINRLVGGKIKRKKNLVKRKKKTNKKGKNHNMKKSHKNNKTKRRKIKK
jgi:hypothetical protein